MIYKFKNSLQTTHITIPFADLKEGTPISIAGAVANDSSAFGIVMNTGDKFVGNGGFFCDAEVIVAGYLDENECEKACGLTYTADMKSALPLIVFVDEFLPETPDELPAVGAGDTGKVLTVGASGLEWDEIGDPLPTPTTEGAVLEVGSVADPSVVILPEQTVEIEEGENYYLPTGGDPTLFVNGAIVCITVNNESLVGTVKDDDDIYVFFDHDCALYYAEDKWWFYDTDSSYGGDPITISVTGTKKGWVEGLNGADVVIRANTSEGEIDSIVVEKNDPNIVQKFTSNPSSVRPFVYYHDTEDDGSISPGVSAFVIREGELSIRSYTMYVKGVNQYVTFDDFLFANGTWVID